MGTLKELEHHQNNFIRERKQRTAIYTVQEMEERYEHLVTEEEEIMVDQLQLGSDWLRDDDKVESISPHPSDGDGYLESNVTAYC